MSISPKQQRLTPLLKYPGVKEKELPYILSNLPSDAQNYFEPFIGGGATFLAVDAQKYYINDKSEELIKLYELVKSEEQDFITWLKQIDHNWKVVERVVENHVAEITEIYNKYKDGRINNQKLNDEISSFVLCNSLEFNGLLSPNFNVGIHNFLNELIKSFTNKIERMVKLEEQKGD